MRYPFRREGDNLDEPFPSRSRRWYTTTYLSIPSPSLWLRMQKPRLDTPGPPIAITISVVCFTFATCYLRLFVFPDIPFFLLGDAIGFVNEGARIVARQLPYRDFFEILPPGTPYTYALLVRIFGLCNWIPLVVMAGLAATTALLMTRASGRIMRGNVVALPALLLAGPILLRSADATHHWFSTVLVLAAMLTLMGKISMLRIAAAGAFCGAAACFTQTKGAMALAGFVIYLIWKSRRENSRVRRVWRNCLVLCGAALAVFLGVNSYFIATAGPSRWFYCLVVYPLHYYPAPTLNNWRVVKDELQAHQSAASWFAFLFVYCTVPLVYLVFLLVMLRQRWKDRNTPWDQLFLITVTGIAMFLAIAQSPSIKRLSTVSPPAMILLAWILNKPTRAFAAVKMTLTAMAAGLAVTAAVHSQTRPKFYLDLPAGRTAFVDTTVKEEYRWVLTNTHPAQFFWGLPPLYVPFHLQNPAATESLDTTEYTRPEDIAAVLQALQQHNVPVIILPSERLYPLTVNTSSNHALAFVGYLHANYRLTRIFANGDELWEKVGPTP